MRHLGMTLALATSLAASTAYAAPAAPDQNAPSAAPRALYICDGSTETRRALLRLHGAVEYISADEAVAAQAAGEVWSAPRCMTEAEFKRLRSMQDRKTLVRAAAR